MIIYLTSKNSGPSWTSDPTFVVYLGTSEEEAREAVGNMARYEQEPGRWPLFKDGYVALGTAVLEKLQPVMVAYYGADGWWYSIVRFDLE